MSSNYKVDSSGAVPEVDDTGFVVWLLEDKCHRLDGPAVIWPNGDLEFWLDGEKVGAVKAGDQT